MPFCENIFKFRAETYLSDKSQCEYQKDHLAMLTVMTQLIGKYIQFISIYYELCSQMFTGLKGQIENSMF